MVAGPSSSGVQPRGRWMPPWDLSARDAALHRPPGSPPPTLRASPVTPHGPPVPWRRLTSTLIPETHPAPSPRSAWLRREPQTSRARPENGAPATSTARQSGMTRAAAPNHASRRASVAARARPTEPPRPPLGPDRAAKTGRLQRPCPGVPARGIAAPRRAADPRPPTSAGLTGPTTTSTPFLHRYVWRL